MREDTTVSTGAIARSSNEVLCKKKKKKKSKDEIEKAVREILLGDKSVKGIVDEILKSFNIHDDVEIESLVTEAFDDRDYKPYDKQELINKLLGFSLQEGQILTVIDGMIDNRKLVSKNGLIHWIS